MTEDSVALLSDSVALLSDRVLPENYNKGQEI